MNGRPNWITKQHRIPAKISRPMGIYRWMKNWMVDGIYDRSHIYRSLFCWLFSFSGVTMISRLVEIDTFGAIHFESTESECKNTASDTDTFTKTQHSPNWKMIEAELGAMATIFVYWKSISHSGNLSHRFCDEFTPTVASQHTGKWKTNSMCFECSRESSEFVRICCVVSMKIDTKIEWNACCDFIWWWCSTGHRASWCFVSHFIWLFAEIFSHSDASLCRFQDHANGMQTCRYILHMKWLPFQERQNISFTVCTHIQFNCIYESIDWIEWVETVLVRQFRSQGLSLVFLFVFLCIFHEEKIHKYWGEIVLHCNSYDPKSQDPIDTYAENNETEQCRVIHLYVASHWYMLRTVLKV